MSYPRRRRDLLDADKTGTYTSLRIFDPFRGYEMFRQSRRLTAGASTGERRKDQLDEKSMTNVQTRFNSRIPFLLRPISKTKLK